MRRRLLSLFALLVLSCNSSPTDPVNAQPLRDGTIVLAVGDSRQLERNVRVSLAAVTEDSRCPKSVVCAWEGNGAVRLDVTAGSNVQSVTLNTAGHTSLPREATAAGFTFALVELAPEKETPDPIPPQRYRATIRVTSAQ
jgi:hypothetical protein